MCSPFFPRLYLSLLLVLAACGGEGLILPGDGGPAALTAVSGNPQQGTVGTRLDDPLVVRVTDSDSKPMAGVPVVFRFQSDVPGAELDPGEDLTNAAGEASARVWLGETAGSHTVEAQLAQAPASDLRAIFDLTAVADEKGKKDKGGRGDDDEDEEEDD